METEVTQYSPYKCLHQTSPPFFCLVVLNVTHDAEDPTYFLSKLHNTKVRLLHNISMKKLIKHMYKKRTDVFKRYANFRSFCIFVTLKMKGVLYKMNL